ncbi:MAG: hypothetical protein GC156_03615 [Actinomycetales bacterium]|nr:hypothetical protein [Actinomycetales bacterium]
MPDPEVDDVGIDLNDDEPGRPDDTIITATHRVGRRVPNLTVGGLDETEILAFAPPMVCDRVHWDAVGDFDARQVLADLPMDAWTRQWSDGQHRVWVPQGLGHEARDLIRAWCVDHEVEAVNIRVEAGVPFRDLDRIPGTLLPDLLAAAVDWLYPRLYAIRRKLVADLDLVDDQDVHSMMYLFVSDHADRYDAGREGRNGMLNFLAFMIGKLRTWPQDAARSAYGRGVVSDRIALTRAADEIAALEQRPATEAELAAALKTSVTDLRRREQAIRALSGMRNYHSLVSDSTDSELTDTVQVADDVDVEFDATAHERNAQLTRAIMAAVNNPESTGRRAQDPLALAAVYLSFWEDLSRPEVARELDVLPKTAAAAVSRVLDSVAAQGLQ